MITTTWLALGALALCAGVLGLLLGIHVERSNPDTGPAAGERMAVIDHLRHLANVRPGFASALGFAARDIENKIHHIERGA